MGYVNRTNSILNRPKRCSDFFRLILQQYNQCHFIFLLFAVSARIYWIFVLFLFQAISIFNIPRLLMVTAKYVIKTFI